MASAPITTQNCNYHKCWFTGCERSKARCPDLHFFRFPTKWPKVCEQWVKNCANDNLTSLSEKTLSGRLVCEMHFIDDCFTSTMKTHLKKNAVPTLLSLDDGIGPQTPKQTADEVRYIINAIMPFCVAFTCNNSSKREGLEKGITFHKFPKDPEKKLAWVKAVGRKNWNPTSVSYLCSEHFEERYIDKTSAKEVRLLDHAIPTIFKGHPNHRTKKKVYKSSSSENESDDFENSDENENQDDLCEIENQEELGEYLKGENENGISESDGPEYTEEALICLIKDNPVLYDKTVPDYWKKIKQNQTWRALADVLLVPVKECQQQWETLLLKYKGQREIIRKFQARGHKAKSTWPLFNAINFMDKHLDEHVVQQKKNKHTVSFDMNHEQRDSSHTSDENSQNSNKDDNDLTNYENLPETRSEDIDMNQESQSKTDEVINDMTQSALIRLCDNVSATKRVITDVNEDVQFVNSLLPILVRMKRKKKALCKADLMTILANYESEDEP